MNVYRYDPSKRKSYIQDGGYFYRNNEVLGFSEKTIIDPSKITTTEAMAHMLLTEPKKLNEEPASYTYMTEEEALGYIKEFLYKYGITPTENEESASLFLAHDVLMNEIKEKRATLLYESDWTQLKDSPLTEEEIVECAVYRQALRDIPSTYSDAIFLHSVIFPEKPKCIK